MLWNYVLSFGFLQECIERKSFEMHNENNIGY